MLACSLKNARSIFLTGVPFPISKQTILRITTSNCVDEGLRWTCGITKSLMSHSLWLELFFSVRKNRRSAGVSRRFARWHSIMYRSIVLPMTKVGPIMLKSTPVWEIKQSASPLAYIVFTPSDSRCWFFFLFVSFLKNLCYVVSSSLFPEKPLSSESTIPLALFWWVLSLVDGPFQYPSKTTTGFHQLDKALTGTIEQLLFFPLDSLEQGHTINDVDCGICVWLFDPWIYLFNDIRQVWLCGFPHHSQSSNNAVWWEDNAYCSREFMSCSSGWALQTASRCWNNSWGSMLTVSPSVRTCLSWPSCTTVSYRDFLLPYILSKISTHDCTHCVW